MLVKYICHNCETVQGVGRNQIYYSYLTWIKELWDMQVNNMSTIIIKVRIGCGVQIQNMQKQFLLFDYHQN